MDVSPEAASRIYDELIDNYSTDGRFEPEGLKVLVDFARRDGNTRQPRRQGIHYGSLSARR